MAFEYHLHIPPNSRRAKAIQEVADRLHLTPEQVVEKVFDDGLRAQPASPALGDIWGAGADDSEVLDAIVADAMAERDERFKRRLDG